ncbi:MAG: hypothetical protein Q9217_003271 [Psora testacea]
MMEYLRSKRGKSPAPSSQELETPVLTEEDEDFLHGIAAVDTPPELPERPPPLPARPQELPEAGKSEGNDAQIALRDGAERISPADAPETTEGTGTPTEHSHLERYKDEVKGKDGKKSRWSWIRRDSRDAKRKATASGLMSVAEGLKSPDAQPNEDHVVSDPEALEEEKEMTNVLDQLNLAAVNNRVFSVSKESQELLHKFTLVLKDLVNGVPTAYGDLESLLTNSEDQLQRSYSHLPPWLQKLVEQLPSKMTKSIGPEMLAAAAEKHGMNPKYSKMAASGAEKAGLTVKVPSLKDLVMKPGAVAGMLKAIMNFLKLRFPAFLGMNVLYSLALFVLLFVFWYCHKRGREVRLEKERLLTEAEIAKLDEDSAEASSSAPPTTTAPEGASIEEIEGGTSATHITGNEGRRSTSQTRYAEGGSLAQFEREKQREKEDEAEPPGEKQEKGRAHSSEMKDSLEQSNFSTTLTTYNSTSNGLYRSNKISLGN